MEYPRNFARFYDLMYNQLRDSLDNEFYLGEIQKTTGRILEIGVGTGRLFIEALNLGAEIYGIDISPEMIKELQAKLKKENHSRISIQNIIDFDFSQSIKMLALYNFLSLYCLSCGTPMRFDRIDNEMTSKYKAKQADICATCGIYQHVDRTDLLRAATASGGDMIE